MAVLLRCVSTAATSRARTTHLAIIAEVFLPCCRRRGGTVAVRNRLGPPDCVDRQLDAKGSGETYIRDSRRACASPTRTSRIPLPRRLVQVMPFPMKQQSTSHLAQARPPELGAPERSSQVIANGRSWLRGVIRDPTSTSVSDMAGGRRRTSLVRLETLLFSAAVWAPPSRATCSSPLSSSRCALRSTISAVSVASLARNVVVSALRF